MTQSSLRFFPWVLLLAACVTWSPAVFAEEKPSARKQSEKFQGPVREPPDREVDAVNLHLRVSFDWEESAVEGDVEHTFRSLEDDLRRVSLHAVDIDVKEVLGANDQILQFESFSDRLEIELEDGVGRGEEIRLRIRYRCQPKMGIYFRYPNRNAPNVPQQIWSQGEAHEARHWIPCFDHPVDKLTSELEVLAPPGLIAISNGELVSTRPADKGAGSWYHWRQSKPHTTYLIAVVVGEFKEYRDDWDGVPLIGYVNPARIADAARSFSLTSDMMEYFSSVLGVRYPWEKYAQICVHEFHFGGMENTSTTILTESTLHDERAALHVSSRDLVAHELAHQWFGDLVTCEDWAHIWINESFATFFETEYRGHLLGEDEEVYGRKEQADDYFYEDRNEYRRPLVTRRYRYPGDMFDNHSYPKGARIVAMLENVLGHKTFYEGLKLFLTREAYQSVDTEDLRKALEDVSGRSLIWFFDQWIYSGGHPEYHVTSEWDDEAKAVRLTVKQVQVLDEVTRLFRMPVDIEVTTKSGAEMHRIEIAKEEETHNFPCESRPLMVRFDKHGWILKELTFEKAREEWLYQLVHDDNILGRMQAAKALGERSGDLTARDALLSRLTEEPFWGVRESIVEALSGFTAGVVRTGLVEAFAREKKSQVRVQIVKSLKELEHEDTSAFLRHAFETDLSYYVAAEALEVLSEVSEDNIFRVLLDALERSSHRDVIRRAALRVIAKMHEEADLESEQLEKAVTAMIPLVEPRHSVSIRRAALNALARLGRGAPEALRGRIFHALANVVDDSFLGARVAAFAALGALGDERGVDLLIARRSKEGERPFRNPLDIIDRAVTAIRAGDGDEGVQKEIERLRKEQDKLKERIVELEGKSG